MSVYYRENPLYLHDALSSVFNQTLPPSEVILVKDGPLTNDLNDVIKNFSLLYKELKVIPLSKNVGLGKALNKGLTYCSCEIVARMDTDDIAYKDRFEKQIKILETHPDIDVVGAWISEFEGSIDNILSIRKVPESHLEIYNWARKRCPMNHPVVMFRKEAVIQAGGYKHFYLFEDYYLWIRMLIEGAKFYNIQECLLYFRFSPDLFKRRGGIRYALVELSFQNKMYALGFLSLGSYMRNVIIRFVVRLIPSSWRSIFYKKILRKSKI